jgi:hypothetical protein
MHTLITFYFQLISYFLIHPTPPHDALFHLRFHWPSHPYAVTGCGGCALFQCLCKVTSSWVQIKKAKEKSLVEPAHIKCQEGYKILRQLMQPGIIEEMEWVKEFDLNYSQKINEMRQDLPTLVSSQIRFFLSHVLMGPALCRLFLLAPDTTLLLLNVFEGLCYYSQYFLEWDGPTLIHSKYSHHCSKARRDVQRQLEQSVGMTSSSGECGVFLEEIIYRYMRDICLAIELEKINQMQDNKLNDDQVQVSAKRFLTIVY